MSEENRPLEPIEVFACSVNELGKLRKVLNRFAAEGYAPLIGTYIPADGGVMLYILGDVSEVGAARIAEPEEISTEADAAAEDIGSGEVVPSVQAPSDPGTNGKSNGAHFSDLGHTAATIDG